MKNKMKFESDPSYMLSFLYSCSSNLFYYFGRYVITPYNEYPQLLGLLLKLLNGELVWSTRREVLKVIMRNK
jgi:hypothetical protein